MSKLIQKLASSFSSKNLSPIVTTQQEDEEFRIIFSDGIYKYTFALYDELGFSEPEWDDEDDEYDKDDYWEEEDPTIYLNIELEEYGHEIEDIELDNDDYHIMFPIIKNYMDKENIDYYRP